MAQYDYDFLVIGAGSGGVRASRIAAGHGARVAVVEDSDLGGTCVNLGCVPKKLFVHASHYHEDFIDAQGYGWQTAQPRFSWQTLLANKNKEIARLNGIYDQLLGRAGVDIICGTGCFVDAHTVQVADRRITAERILIATGSTPYMPTLPGQEYAINSDQAFHLKTLPQRAIVVGGGYIAVEFAGIFQGLGVETTLIYRGPQLLRGFDDTVREFVCEQIQKKGIKLCFETQIKAIEKHNEHLTAHLDDDTTLNSDLILYATGRVPKIQALNLAAAGVEIHKDGHIPVNKDYQTNVPSVYALGDIIGGPQLTPTAIAEGHILADNIFAGMQRKLDYTFIPTAVFCQPNIGTVGLTEQQAREQHADIKIYQSTFRALKHTLTGRDEKTLIKLIVDEKTDKVLGAHMVGEAAGEIIQGVAIAVQMGATKADFDNTLAIHPTVAEEFVTLR